MEIKVIIASAIVLVTHCVMAQRATEDIPKINSALTSAEKLAIELSYKVYPDSVSKKALQSSEGRWVKNGTSQYHQLGSMETINKTGDIQVAIDHENKTVVLSNAPELDKNNMTVTMTASIESLLGQCKTVKYRSINALLGAYDMYPSPMVSEYSKLTIVFDKKKFYPVKMILQTGGAVAYTDGEEQRETAPRIEIDFKIVNAKDEQLALTDLSRYVFKKGNDYRLTVPYKEYEFNNYLITK